MALFKHKEKSEININLREHREKSAIDIYLNEYNIVTSKITSLSLKFASGSYIIPISLIVGAASINYDNAYISIIAMIMPIVLYLHVYNHIRYMALQFKLSGYAKHLENRINEIANEKEGEQILLWENTIARNNKQNIFEGYFLGITYFLLLILVLYIAYDGLFTTMNINKLHFGLSFLVSAIYYFAFFSIVFFLIFFTKEHDRSYKMAKNAARGAFSTSNVKGRGYVLKILVVLVITVFLPTSLLPLVFFSEKLLRIQLIHMIILFYLGTSQMPIIHLMT